MPKAAPKIVKIPKSLGACADLLYDLREGRLALQREADAVKPSEAAVREHIIATLPKGDHGAIGQHHKAVVEPKVIYQVTDWEAFYKHVARTKDFSLLNKALNAAHVVELLEAGKKMPPGVERFDTVVVSLTKV